MKIPAWAHFSDRGKYFPSVKIFSSVNFRADGCIPQDRASILRMNIANIAHESPRGVHPGSTRFVHPGSWALVHCGFSAFSPSHRVSRREPRVGIFMDSSRGCSSDWPRRGFPSPQDRTKSGQNRHLGVRGPYSIQAVAIFGRSAISKKNARNLVKTRHLFGFVHECRGVSLRFRRKDTRARSFGLRIPARYARGRQGVSVLDSCRKSNIRWTGHFCLTKID